MTASQLGLTIGVEVLRVLKVGRVVVAWKQRLDNFLMGRHFTHILMSLVPYLQQCSSVFLLPFLFVL